MNGSQLADLRAELARRSLDGFVVPRADEYLGEYVPPSAERLAWLTGFTGSAGFAVVLAERAAVFTDGRYMLQMAAETDAAQWEQLHITEQPPHLWLAAAVSSGARIGYDPMLMSEEGVQRLTEAGVTMAPASGNPIDAVWADRPASPMHPVEIHSLAFAGQSSSDKRTALAQSLRQAKQDAVVLTDPASIAWLLNIRGSDLEFTPVALGFAILHADATCDLFMAPQKFSHAVRDWLGEAVHVHPRAELAPKLAALAGRRVRVDRAGSPAWFAQTLRAGGGEMVAGTDPCLLPKALKNATEQAGTRAAHLRDGVALCRFLHWLDSAAGHATEMSAAAELLACRRAAPEFRGESFPAISGAGEHGAIIHYRVSPATDRPIRADELYLIDSGAQYPDGTTDVTRTIWTGRDMPPAELRDCVTRVLKGHIAIAALVFPQGIAGAHIDAFARQALWQAGLDYDHGTGHGIGSYLSVHEGPAGLSRAARPVALEGGMILSDEPGYYAPGRFGIRLENLLLVQPADLPAATRPFLRFETLTLAPFDRRLIEPALLTLDEVAWIDTYHARVLAELGPLVPEATLRWLEAATARLGV